MTSRNKQPETAPEEKNTGKSTPSLSDADWKDIGSDTNNPSGVPENADFRYDDDGDGSAENAMNEDKRSPVPEGGKGPTDRG